MGGTRSPDGELRPRAWRQSEGQGYHRATTGGHFLSIAMVSANTRAACCHSGVPRHTPLECQGKNKAARATGEHKRPRICMRMQLLFSQPQNKGCEQRCVCAASALRLRCARGGQPLRPTFPVWACLISGQWRRPLMQSIPCHGESTPPPSPSTERQRQSQTLHEPEGGHDAS